MSGPALVSFHHLALREYRAATRWYAHRSPQAGNRFQNAVERAVARLATSPESAPRFGRNHHWVRAGRFPYVLYYRIIDSDHILVMAVAHARRRFGYWTQRRPDGS